MTLVARVIFAFVAVNALAGALALLFLPTMTDVLFFWEIKPPLNAALFGALYLGGAAVVGYVTWRGKWEPARFLIPVLVSAGIFISITTLLHLDRFSPGLKLFYWLVIYVGAPLLALGLYWQHERGGANWQVTTPLTTFTRIIAGGMGAVLVLGGMGLMVAPHIAIPTWPWNMTPLMIRIFASWFSAFGVGLLWFLVDKDWNRLKLIPVLMIAASSLDLVMVWIHRADLTMTGPILWVYLFHLALFGILGSGMIWLQKRAAQPRSSSSN